MIRQRLCQLAALGVVVAMVMALLVLAAGIGLYLMADVVIGIAELLTQQPPLEMEGSP